MTDTTTEPTDGAQETPTTTPKPTPVEEGDDGGGNEAARYRRRLRQAEAERDALAERLTAHRRAEVERLASAALAQGSDVWMDDADLDAWLDDDGMLDVGAVEEHVNGLLERRPGLGHHVAGPRERPKSDVGIDPDQPPRPLTADRNAQGKSWADLLGSKPSRR